VRLPRLIGPAIAAEAILTGRAFDAEEALRARWVNVILPAAKFLDSVVRWAGAIAEHAGPALSAAKKSIVHGTRLSFVEAQALEQELFRQLTASGALR
jgi:enoyl-CoA hydratase